MCAERRAGMATNSSEHCWQVFAARPMIDRAMKSQSSHHLDVGQIINATAFKICLNRRPGTGDSVLEEIMRSLKPLSAELLSFELSARIERPAPACPLRDVRTEAQVSQFSQNIAAALVAVNKQPAVTFGDR